VKGFGIVRVRESEIGGAEKVELRVE